MGGTHEAGMRIVLKQINDSVATKRREIPSAEAAGLGHAAMVPDALALPRPPEGAWAVELANDRAIGRSGDGTGFALPASMLRAAWQAAGSPPVTAYGAPLPDDMMAGQGVFDSAALHAPALDLRQGPYAHRRALPNLWRRLGWIAAIGAVAHIGIAAADTLMLRAIADRRAAETRAAAQMAAPGVAIGDDLAGSVADMLPSGGGGAPDRFVPLLARLSRALAPVAGGFTVRAIGYQANAMIMDLQPDPDPGLQARIDAALKSANVPATVTRSADGAVRITASAA
jgi:general secretion pathway protein L